MIRIKMRVPQMKAMSLRGRWMHWNSWKGWLYLTIFVFISGRLFVSQGFSLTLTPTFEKTDSTSAPAGDNVNNIAPKNHGDRGLKMALITSTWSTSSPFGHGPTSREEVHLGSNHLPQNVIRNKTRPLLQDTENDDEDSRNWNPTDPSLKSNDENNETTNQRKKEPVNHSNNNNNNHILKEKERRYWQRSERIKRVCHNWGVVPNRLVFATSKNETRPVHSPSSNNLPSKCSSI